MNQLKILHIQSDIGDSGGISNYISNFIKKSNKRFNLFVTCSKQKKERIFASDLYKKSQIILIDIDRYNFFNVFINAFRLSKTIKDNSIDLLHAHALRSGLLACINKIFFSTKYIYTNHGLRFTQKKGILKKILFYFLEVLIVLFSNYTCCIRTSDHKKLTTSPLNFLYKSKIKLVKTKLKLPKYCPIKTNSVEKIIIGIGSLIDVKRPFIFLQIINELYKINKNIKAVWIGDGFLKNELIKINKRIQAPIKWLGHCNHEEVKKHLEISNLTLLTSEVEVFPLSVIESYWGGIPVISFQFFGVEDFIKDDYTGLLFPKNKNFRSIAYKINSLIHNEEKCLHMSRNVTNYFWENLYDLGDTYDLYYELYILSFNQT